MVLNDATTDTDVHMAEVGEASYPIPNALSRIIRNCIEEQQNENAEESNNVCEVESLESAVEQLMANAFHAVDEMYFATPSRIRNRSSFAHRLCIRIETDITRGLLSITDMGIGMTRADIINCLGVGAPLSDRARQLCLSSTDNDDTNNNESKVVPCRSSDVGGFYSALCALGTEINVGTKSSHDDYYEFSVGSDCSHFVVTRPLAEGTLPSVSNGFDRFSDVRGERGTRVTIKLHERAKGLLEEQRVLKPIIAKLLTTTQYSAAFSTDDPASVRSIIQASQVEMDDLADLQNSTHDDDLLQDQQQPTHKDKDKDNKAVPSSPITPNHASVKERSKFIPLRLSLSERKMLRLVEAATSCSEYTADIDNHKFKSQAHRTHAQLQHITSILQGMVTACDYTAGQTLLESRDYSHYEQFFRQMFEITRRHKIMNPAKMRENYGKLIFCLQDAVTPETRHHLGFSCTGTIQTVYDFLASRSGISLLEDELIEVATQEVLAEKKSRNKIAQEIKRKEKAVKHLKTTYRSSKLSQEEIHLCLYSICDNNSFLNSNRLPIDKIISYLHKFFEPSQIEEGYSLAITSGQDGARLSHSHERQYYFALQSLTLWRDIIDDMFRLWHMAEEDLLSEHITYALKNTGQGMQRVQQCPKTYKAMQGILKRVQSKVKLWVGSTVIHMGDHNVPNALSFIDKYTQVPRILCPIVTTLEAIERIHDENQGIKHYIDTAFGGLDALKKDILYDFFKSAFDGSGADNFYDAGSCIDGRLTSAWNWCEMLNQKKYFAIFKLAGFTGFDGEFK